MLIVLLNYCFLFAISTVFTKWHADVGKLAIKKAVKPTRRAVAEFVWAVYAVILTNNTE